MKRKKWSEQEERTLISKYSELLRSGTLAKLKTREKKFKPVADHVNAVHHHSDPTTFPFTWSWRDVSIKVQNMRHQYLGVKQKIKSLSTSSPHSFNWNDGLNHWENFLYYKEVFGDIPSKSQQQQQQQNSNHNNNEDSFRNLGFSSDDDGGDDDDEDELDEECENEGDLVGEVGGRVLELREVMVKREERRREREEGKAKEAVAVEVRERRRMREEVELDLEVELEERRLRWARREVLRRARLERELEEERRWRKRAEERMEEEEMEWRERMVAMQVEHEKQMMQMHVDACQSNMQILGIMARILCQFFGGAGSDGLGGGGGGGTADGGVLGPLPPQVLQNLEHAGELGNVKPDANSPSEFI